MKWLPQHLSLLVSLLLFIYLLLAGWLIIAARWQMETGWRVQWLWAKQLFLETRLLQQPIFFLTAIVFPSLVFTWLLLRWLGNETN